MQASEIGFVQKIKEVTMFDKVRNTAIQEALNIESLLLWIERSLLRWFGHVSRMPQEQLPKQTLCAEVNGKRLNERSRTKWLDYNEDLDWNRLGLFRNEVQSVLVDREVRLFNQELLPTRPSGKSR